MSNDTNTTIYPDLSGVASADDVSTKGTGNFAASYINWSRTMQFLRTHAPGWMPIAERTDDGGMAHVAPDGSRYLLLYFEHPEHGRTPAIPHAVMDHKMKAIPGDRVSARDISDGFVRGTCKAAAVLFGLAWQMWSKDDPMERSEDEPPRQQVKAKPARPKAEPYDFAEEATAAIARAFSADELHGVADRITSSGFQGADLDMVRAAFAERKDEITNNPATTNGSPS